jgi:hypothetical protein
MDTKIPRCQAIPVADHQVAFEIDGIERLRWHYGPNYPRPFFYPLRGPSGKSLTRMGHPGAPDHDHHRSIWFAHAKVLGIDFWSDKTAARIRQKQWLCYQDGVSEAAMAVLLGWCDGHDPKELMEQQVVAGVRPGPDGETLVELQSTFTPTAESIELSKSNFGVLAVRVAKGLSEHFGGGRLTNSEGAIGEHAIFGKPAKWMDYSGPITNLSIEGITYFDHPANPGHPVKWHVREDGWMGASLCMDEPRLITRKQPLVLRYLLHAHRGPVNPEAAARVAKEFADSGRYKVAKAKIKHTQYTIARV